MFRNKGRKEKKEGKRGKEREKEESSLGFSTHFRAVQFNIVTDISAVCNLNESLQYKRRDKNLFLYISEFYLTF